MHQFYAARRENEAPASEPLTGEALLFSEEPPGHAGPVIDDNFINLVFEWVSKDPEVTVKEAEAVGAPPELSRPKKKSKKNEAPATDDHDETDTPVSPYARKRLVTGDDRIWYAITGHGIDYKRIPNLEFEALAVIASHGAKGVLQPDVTAETGQDKRSLPKRTDNLAKNGYIVKTTVIARGTKTSLLKLKKFDGNGEMLRDHQAQPGTTIIEYNSWFEKAIKLLKQNDNIIAFEDLRVGLGIQTKRYETRALHRCIRRLAKAGCLRKVTARVVEGDGVDGGPAKTVRSLQLLREPTDSDRIAFMRSDWNKSGHLTKLRAMEGAAARLPDEDALDEDVDADDDGDGDRDDEYEEMEALDNPRTAPLWTPDIPFANFIRDRIEDAGPQGLCSADLFSNAVGHFWKRSTDEMLIKLTDLWQYSQPPHLRHLSVIRDTGLRGKQPVFQYRTYANFEKAVEAGTAFWEGITDSDPLGKNQNRISKKKLNEAAAAQPVLDEWGFPTLPSQVFVGGTGAATLEECRKAAISRAGAKSGFAWMSEPQHGANIGQRPEARTKPGTDSSRQYQAEYRQRRQIEKEKEAWAKSARKIATRRAHAEFAAAPLKRTASEAGLDNSETPAQRIRTEGASLGAASTSLQQTDGPSSPSAPVHNLGASHADGDTPTKGLRRKGKEATGVKRKKTGRPTKAMLAERERLQKLAEVKATWGEDSHEYAEAAKAADEVAALQNAKNTVDPHLEARIAEITSEIVNLSKPGVYIEPPGAKLLKAMIQKMGKGPRKTKIAVFKSQRLKDFDWFKDEGYGVSLPEMVPQPQPRTPRKTQATSRRYEEDEMLDDADPANESQERERQRDIDDNLPESVGGEREPEGFDMDIEENATPSHQIVGVDSTLQADPPTVETRDKASTPADTAILGADRTATSGDYIVPVSYGDAGPQPKTDSHSDGVPEITVQKGGDVAFRQQSSKVGANKNSGGALHIKRTKIAMDIVESCGGIFPGRNEMWFPFRTVWSREFGHVPDKKTVDNVIKSLLNLGKLKKLTFIFKTKKGETKQWSILAKPDIDPNSTAVRTMQKCIMDTYPATYLPEEAEVSIQLREHIGRNTQIAHNEKVAKKNAPEPPEEVDAPKDLPPHYIRDDFPEDQSVIVKRIGLKAGLGLAEKQLSDYKNLIQKRRQLAERRAQEVAAREERKQERARKSVIARDADFDTSDDDEEPVSEEQAALQGEMQLDSYQHDSGAVNLREHPTAKLSQTLRLGKRDTLRHQPSRLPGRVLRPRKKPHPVSLRPEAQPQTLRTADVAAPDYPLASSHAHSVQTLPLPTVSRRVNESAAKTLQQLSRETQPGREARTYEPFQWVVDDGSSMDPPNVPRVQPPSFKEAFARPTVSLSARQKPTYGLMAPPGEHVHFAGAPTRGADLDATYVPQSLQEILAEDHIPAQPAIRSDRNEAANFFDEVDRVEQWEKQALKNPNQAFVRGKENPFINHTSPAVISQPPAEAVWSPKRVSKRTREVEEPHSVEEELEPKRRFQSRRKTTEDVQPSPLPSTTTRKLHRRDRQTAAAFSDKQYDRLIKAMALVYTVAGGLGGRTNWFMISHALSYRYSSEFLRHRWDKVRSSREHIVKQMQSQLWEPFLEAYEAGDLPIVNFENLEETDWPALLEWVEGQILTTNSAAVAPNVIRVPQLPATDVKLRSDYEIKETDSAPLVAREEFYSAITDKRRMLVAVNQIQGHTISTARQDNQAEDENHLLRSLARATVLTPDEHYDDERANEKIACFDEIAIVKVLAHLDTEKILQPRKKGRTMPGRNYDIRDVVIREFRRWPGRELEHMYLPVVAAKRSTILDQLQDQDQYELSFSADDEEMLVLTQMVAQGLLKVTSKLPDRNDDFDAPWPKITKWGYTGFNYTARAFDRTRLRFDIVYEKTDNFSFDHGLKTNVPIPMHMEQVPGEPGLRLPLWVDIHDEVMPPWWDMVVRSILHLLVFRPGLDAAEIVTSHKNKLWLWETELALSWMEEVGLAVRSGEGYEEDGVWKGGWRAGEWWYCMACPGVLFPTASAESGELEEVA